LADASSIEVSESSLTFDAADAGARPVAKVITLLKDMMKQMKKEAEEDEDVYDKMACWSETTTKEKTKSIDDANTRISELSTSIEQKTAQGARLNTEIANLNKEAAEDQTALDEAIAIRAKQLAEFNAEEKDVLLTISSLKNGIISLSKHNSFMQTPLQMDAVAAAVQDALQKHALMLSGVLTPTQRREVALFVQGPGQDAPQGGEIFGILKQMKETFETNLAASQKEEGANIKAFEDLKAAKEAEIKAGKDQSDTKSDQLAENNDQLSQHKQDKSDTKKSLAADGKFLANVKQNYASEKTEYAARVKTRSEELEAVTTAEGILNSDDAHDLMSKSLGFLQTDMTSDRRAQAAKLLSAVAQKVQNPRLAVLAVGVRLDAFVKVRKAIDEMVVALGKEKKDEIKKKDFCLEEFNQNAMAEHLTTREKTDTQAKIAQLTTATQKLVDEIAALDAEVAQLQADLKKAGEGRDKQRKEFQSTVADQRASQKVLASAMNVLKGFYAANKDHAAETGLLQTKQPLIAGGDPYKSSGASGKVMGMIQSIITDAKAMEAEAIRDEADAEKAFANFTKETNDSIATKNDSIANKKATASDKKSAKVEAKKDLEATMLELEQLANTKAELHQSCDFTVKNFDVRQTARDEEVEALKQAKSILSGSKFEAFLQGQ